MKKKLVVFLLVLTLLSAVALAELSPVKRAEEYKDQFPDVYASYKANGENDQVIDYLKTYPILAVLYEGVQFSVQYDSARGHEYSVEDVTNTQRKHPLANCLTCKTPDFTLMAQNQGDEAYALPFETALSSVVEPVSCYNCHANNPPTLTVTHAYQAKAMEGENVDPKTLACAQCHVEYYFPKGSATTTLAYQGLAEATPDAILAHYDEIGFSDFVNPRTGTELIKVQHPEFETFQAGSVHATMFTCADCHMPPAKNDKGEPYRSHKLVSPLADEGLAASCNACHKDITKFVTEGQAATEARTVSAGEGLVEYVNALAKAVEDKTVEGEKLAELQKLHRHAQFYWDFVFVENSEGIHNRKLTDDCLSKCEELTAKGMALLNP